ncbi:MAG: hypothetical protein R3E79_09635 [Caldilineaceae bacterium]
MAHLWPNCPAVVSAPLAALAVFAFLGNWDSYLWPLVVLSSPDKQTLPLVLAGLRNLWWTLRDVVRRVDADGDSGHVALQPGVQIFYPWHCHDGLEGVMEFYQIT